MAAKGHGSQSLLEAPKVTEDVIDQSPIGPLSLLGLEGDLLGRPVQSPCVVDVLYDFSDILSLQNAYVEAQVSLALLGPSTTHPKIGCLPLGSIESPLGISS